ncbi:hypothetical protein PTNB29_02019 [Pyrenophora teres f. teres]|nr:hypothetical protein PTNB29_02019 [Pyrenophora teres f. teres]
MGFSFHGHKRDVDAEKHLRRMHKTTPFIESPLVGADHKDLVFSQRHEANSVELFFDLFFVANLATFTAYHSITDGDYLLGYIGFFGILWSCWFQITLHDVRFARDSLYERVCKTIQFIVFVGLALVGSQFNPASTKGKMNSTNFRILCYTLVISRGLLAIQYLVVLFFTWRAKYSKLFLPLILMFAIYAVSMAAFAGMTPAFSVNLEFNNKRRLGYLVWYVVMVLEAIAVITISCFWRMLSFKKTHLMERMSLLTIIVIGEGAIGVTKTVSRIMGKHGLEVEGCFLIMCIIVVLVLIWALYFDNFPHGHYGTIRQQIWSLLHFPFQLGIVGIVEGAQQIALARFITKNARKITNTIVKHCQKENLDGEKLQDSLMQLLEYFQLNKKAETRDYFLDARSAIWAVGNSTGICSPENAATYTLGDEAKDSTWPDALEQVISNISNGMYTGLGMKLPVDKLEKYSPLEVGLGAWRLVYLYAWCSFCLIMICLILFLFLIRRHKADLFDYTSIISRSLALGVGGAMLALMADSTRLYAAIESPALLPIIVVLLFSILVVDKISVLYCNKKLEKSNLPYALEYEEHGHHKHGHHEHLEHDSPKMLGSGHHKGPLHNRAAHGSIAGPEEMLKAARWSAQPEDVRPLTAHSTGYHTPHQEYALEPLRSPALHVPSPDLEVHTEYVGSAPGGYAPEEMIRVDRGFLREARTGLEAALKQLDRVSCCGAEHEESMSIPKEVAGDDASVKVARFLDGRRVVDSPLPSPALLSRPTTESYDGTDSFYNGEAGSESGWTDCDVHRDERRRKDSAFEVSAQPDPIKDDALTAVPVKEAVEQQEPNGDDYSQDPCTPMTIAFGPKKDLDWLRFSYLIRNDQLSFDDIAALVTRSFPDDNTSKFKEDVRQRSSVVEIPDSGDIALSVAVYESGRNQQLGTCDVSPLEEQPPGFTFGHVGGVTIRRVTSSEARDDDSVRRCKPAPLRAQTEDDQTRSRGEWGKPLRDTYGNEGEAVYSCFSSDSSIFSIEHTSKLSNPANKTRSPTTSWWKPKRKREGTSQELTTLSSPPPVPPKDHTARLWQRMSKNTLKAHPTIRKLERKSHFTLSCSSKEKSSRHSNVSTHVPVHRSSDWYIAYRRECASLLGKPDNQQHASPHILSSMRYSSRPRFSDTLKSSGNGKTHRSSHGSSKSAHSRPRSSQAAKVSSRSIHQPYKPSPLKKVTRAASLNLNKELPPLPPEGRRITHKAFTVTLREVVGVRKVAIKKVVNEYVREMAKAY